MRLVRLCLVLFSLGFGTLAQGQSGEPVPALEAWETLATRAETTVEAAGASTFALTRLRDELFLWRDAFSQDQTANAGRLATIADQIEALGEALPQEEGAPTVLARRNALVQEQQRLRIPVVLAAESHARANGLISEIDALIRKRDAERLTTRGPTPLNPAHWQAGAEALTKGLGTLFGSTAQRLGAEGRTGSLLRDLPVALITFGIALILLWRGRKLAVKAADWSAGSGARWRVLWAFLLSLGQMILPLIGLLALVVGLSLFNLLDFPGAQLDEALLVSGMVIIFVRWLCAQLFPIGGAPGPLSYDEPTRDSLRRAAIALSIALAVWFLLGEIVALSDPSDLAVEVALTPIQLLSVWLLFRLGALMRTPPINADLPTSSGGRVRSIFGRLAMVVAIATPILSILGYAAAAQAVFLPSVLTLTILGVVIVLQRLVMDLFTPQNGVEDEGPLLPVLIGFGLFVVALPFLALVWGARPADLFEIWTRFRAGVALGETRISPTDLLTFLVIFGLGYLLTRFVQSTLRKSVLPRTKLDLGGRNAIVSGLGYVGIFLAAIVAITSAGIDLSNLAIVAGALSVGIGFGLQNIVQNFVSGIILLIERPIGEGDMIEVNGQMGFVRDISVRSTRIETFDRTDVIIPNADLVSGQVTNWTRGNAVGRLILPVGVAYGSDVQTVKNILQEVAIGHPMVLHDPPPQVLFTSFGASSLDFEIRAILRDVNWKLVTASEMNETINARFTAAGIEIPFPQTDLWLRNPETLRSTKPEEPEE